MPYDDPAPDDPQQLVGVCLPDGDPDEMARILVEEFLKLGFSDEQLWQLFRSRFYTGAHAILRARGEAYVGSLIAEARAKWGYWGR